MINDAESLGEPQKDVVKPTQPANTLIADNWSRPFFRSILSGPDGSGSSSRIGILLTIFAALGWISICVWKTHTIPDLSGLTLYETSIITALYAPNKVSEVLAKIKK